MLSAEYLLLATLLGIGLIVGIKSVRDSLVEELHQLAVAIGHVDFGHHDQDSDDSSSGGSGGDFQVAADAFPEG